MSVPRRAAHLPLPHAPLVDVGPWADGRCERPALALQRRLAREWSPAVGVPERSALRDRVEGAIAATSRAGGPILFGAALAGFATLLT